MHTDSGRNKASGKEHVRGHLIGAIGDGIASALGELLDAVMLEDADHASLGVLLGAIQNLSSLGKLLHVDKGAVNERHKLVVVVKVVLKQGHTVCDLLHVEGTLSPCHAGHSDGFAGSPGCCGVGELGLVCLVEADGILVGDGARQGVVDAKLRNGLDVLLGQGVIGFLMLGQLEVLIGIEGNGGAQLQALELVAGTEDELAEVLGLELGLVASVGVSKRDTAALANLVLVIEGIGKLLVKRLVLALNLVDGVAVDILRIALGSVKGLLCCIELCAVLHDLVVNLDGRKHSLLPSTSKTFRSRTRF